MRHEEVSEVVRTRWSLQWARFHEVYPAAFYRPAIDVEMRIKVSDTGSGIPVEALPRVFDRFFRVDPSRSKNSGGTGLGLAIVQSILTLHGGKAEITSELGRGTCVTLRIPTRAPR